nr:unnamed protein product [Callosobruchus analis]
MFPISPIPKHGKARVINGGNESGVIDISDDEDEPQADNEEEGPEDPKVTDDEDDSPAVISISSVGQDQSSTLEEKKQRSFVG